MTKPLPDEIEQTFEVTELKPHLIRYCRVCEQPATWQIDSPHLYAPIRICDSCRTALVASLQPAAPGVTHDPVVAMHDAAPLDDEPVTDDDRRAIAEGWAAYQSAPGVTVREGEANTLLEWCRNMVSEYEALRARCERLRQVVAVCAASITSLERGDLVTDLADDLARPPGAEDEEEDDQQ